MRSGWTTHAALAFMCSRKDGRSLVVYLSPEPGMLDAWHMMALETTAERGLQRILDDHAHADQGTVHGLVAAMHAAEAFGKKWQRRKVAIEECPCEELAGDATAAE